MPALLFAAATAPSGPAAARQPDDPVKAAFVLIGPDGAAVARVITTSPTCPRLKIDGVGREMTLRATASMEPQRPTRSTAAESKPSAFPVTTCEMRLPRAAKSVTLDGLALPAPRAAARRIVVIGDTGCRLKASDHAFQACNDTAAYPFARIAASAAAWGPDLVIHVGDLLYRENACPRGNSGCAGSPWGYGWDAWDADLFTPAAPLLAAAPWVMVRGNHESCNRAGQGWWRFADANPLRAGRDCNVAGNDAIGNGSTTFAVPLGGSAQVVVMDLASAGEDPLEQDDPRAVYLRRVQLDVIKLAKRARFNFAVGHYPIFGLRTVAESTGNSKLEAGNQALISVFRKRDPALRLPGIDILLSGHIHTFEQIDLGRFHPSQFISGMSGTLEDQPRINAGTAIGMQVIPGLTIKRFASDGSGFGFMSLERTGLRRWKVELHGIDGTVLRRCTTSGRRTRCNSTGSS